MASAKCKLVFSFCLLLCSNLIILTSTNPNYGLRPGIIFQEYEASEEILNPCTESNFRFDRKSSRCHQLGREGPCGSNMIFVMDPDSSIYGYCDCRFTPRTLIYDQSTEQCYPIFTQGYCKAGEWLTLSPSTGQPICKINHCLRRRGRGRRNQDWNGQKVQEYVPFGATCLPLGKKVPECAGMEIIGFEKGKIFPTCISSYSNYALGAINSIKKCAPGSVRSVSGGCQRHWVW